jgi:acetyl esterase
MRQPTLLFASFSYVLLLAAVQTNVVQPSVAQAGEPREPAREPARPTRTVEYKSVGDVKLRLHMFEPAGHSAAEPRPAIVFFFGGGWNGGSPQQFYEHCRYFASRGMVAAAAEYRVKSKHGTTPRQCVEDGKSALRFLRSHAKELGIDPRRIAAGGGSAGGHVAAATGTVEGLNAAEDDLAVSAVPDVLVLFNPVFDNGPTGYGHDRVKAYWKDISPLHNIHAKMPPAIVFLGTKDSLIPVATAEAFRDKMRASGVRSELRLYEDQPHGFFNYNREGGRYYRETVAEADRFLAELNFLTGEPAIGSSP